jgi:hypothetical protein
MRDLSAERERVASFGRPEDGLSAATPWYAWGPYVSERAWGTVREDYSADGTPWEYLPHEHARSQAFRWSEDGLAGICDVHQRLCLGLALWNGRDRMLKERIFGLNGDEGNHGEDAKEYWWYLDALPSHAWLRWRYHYPQPAFPYDDLVATNRARSRQDPEYELLDTAVFDADRYWVVEVDYAKADPTDLLMRVRVTNAGAQAAELHVLPTLWFRNRWDWGGGVAKPSLRAQGAMVVAEEESLGRYALQVGPGPDGAAPPLLFCENETNAARLFGAAESPAYPKDGIGDHVLHGAASVNPDGVGTKAAAWYRLTLGGGESAELRLALRECPKRPTASRGRLGAGFERLMALRESEADEFYDELAPGDCTAEERAIMRQAFAGVIWGKQYYNYDVARWLDGDPGQPPPPSSRLSGRNSSWRHLLAQDIVSMPDPWEYPWFAAWDLGFHAVVLAHLDPAFAKYQLLLLCREWMQSPGGALPAYEWAFGEVNPPVHAWAAMKVWAIDGARDHDFLERIFHKLLVNFTWWVNRKDSQSLNVFEGGFLGLDNISAIDRSKVPGGEALEQSDATGWMAFYCLTMLTIAAVLARHDSAYEDLVLKFLEHFAAIAEALERGGLWDEQDGFYYDVLAGADGSRTPLRVASIAGLIPLLPTVVLDAGEIRQAAALRKAFARLHERHGEDAATVVVRGTGASERVLLSAVGRDRILRLLGHAFDESEFLSPFGLRSLSARLRDQPYSVAIDGETATVDYEPAESTTTLFGGNSNWRGPVWMPLNYLFVDALARLGEQVGDAIVAEYPTGSGEDLTLTAIAADLRRRLIALWLPDGDGRRPVFGGVERMQSDPRWRENLLFYEYFNGDDGAGLGASHQTGWSALVADLIVGRRIAADPGARSLYG